MLALGLMGSPRKNGNTAFLLKSFMDELEKKGATIRMINVPEKNIKPCQGCIFCEQNGYCRMQDDDMSRELYPLLRRAEVIVAASPMYFYSVTSQLKALIDRSQALWSRRYRLKLADPRAATRAGVMLAVGATKGKNLFEGTHFTAKYFFDAVAANFSGEMGYRRVENPGDLRKLPAVPDEVKAEAAKLDPLFSRQKILFLCVENACRSKMAAAFAGHLAGARFETASAGSAPAGAANPVMVEAMAEKGIDLFLDSPRSISEALAEMKPDKIVTMGCEEDCPYVPGAEVIQWNIPDPKGLGINGMRSVRDEIEQKVRELTGI
ncbi:MAG: NAD(P)H-dependent oxidoreductase [Thermodesulfobacteriota bacterium]